MWGIYEDGNSLDGISYAYRYDTMTSWSIGNNAIGANTVLRNGNSAEQDLGVWAVGSAQTVPEPGTLSLLGIGLVGATIISRIRNRKA
jgi:hypothetical protein